MIDENRQDPEVGHVQWHCSEHGSGPDVGVLLRIAEDQFLWCGEITNRRFNDGGFDIGETDNFGTWLIMYGRGDAETYTIGKVDYERGRQMIDDISLVMRSTQAKP